MYHLKKRTTQHLGTQERIIKTVLTARESSRAILDMTQCIVTIQAMLMTNTLALLLTV